MHVQKKNEKDTDKDIDTILSVHISMMITDVYIRPYIVTTPTCIYLSIYIYMDRHIHICIYIYIYIYVYMHGTYVQYTSTYVCMHEINTFFIAYA